MMSNIIYGDVRDIIFNDDKINIILQVCNNVGKYGAGLSGSLASRWPKVRDEYFSWNSGTGKGASDVLKLGEIQFVSVQKHVAIINMIAQNGVRGPSNPKPIHYPSLEMCLIKLFAKLYSFVPRFKWKKIHIWCPQIGSGLAGGDWNIVEEKVTHWFNRPEFILTYIYFRK